MEIQIGKANLFLEKRGAISSFGSEFVQLFIMCFRFFRIRVLHCIVVHRSRQPEEKRKEKKALTYLYPPDIL